MRVILLSCYWLLDRLDYKRRVLAGLVSRKPEVLSLVYVNTRFIDYYREFRKRYKLRDLFCNIGQGKMNITNYRSNRLERSAGELGVKVLMFESFDKKCVDYLLKFRPDIVYDLTALFIPYAVLRIARYGLVGAHHGNLPDVRGSAAIRWTILLDHPMVVSHMFLAPHLDMGDILLKIKVDVRRGDDIEIIRPKRQGKNAVGHLVVYDKVLSGTLRPVKQTKSEGSTFFRTGDFLKDKVDALLASCQYLHYADSLMLMEN